MGSEQKGDKNLTLVDGLLRIKPEDLKITLNKSESVALKKALLEEEKARKSNFALRGAIRR